MASLPAWQVELNMAKKTSKRDASSLSNVTKKRKVVIVIDQHKQRLKSLQKTVVPLIKEGLTRAEIIREGVSGGVYCSWKRMPPPFLTITATR
jgi:hypothetical protein